jgi:Ulp1 family protease
MPRQNPKTGNCACFVLAFVDHVLHGEKPQFSNKDMIWMRTTVALSLAEEVPRRLVAQPR